METLPLLLAQKFRLFFQELSQYGIPFDKLRSAYIESSTKQTTLTSVSAKDVRSFQLQSFIEKVKSSKANESKYSTAELKEICKSKGLKITGNKAQLLARVEGRPEPSKTKKLKFPEQTKGKIIDKIRSRVARIGIVRHENGLDFWHPETGLVFDPVSQHAIASFRHGKKHNLNASDVEKCLELNIPYFIPRNLDEGMNRVVDEKLANVLTADDFHEEDEEEEDEEEEDGDDEENF